MNKTAYCTENSGRGIWSVDDISMQLAQRQISEGKEEGSFKQMSQRKVKINKIASSSGTSVNPR